jgi:penicillin-binding protein 1C
VLVLAALAVASWVALPIPASLLAPEARQTLTIEDRHGLVLRSTRAEDGNLARWVPLAEMDPDLLRAFVAVEDRRFYRHNGVDPHAILRAARDNFERRRVVAGASTLTMQLARLITPIDRSWTGKVLQAFWAFRLEAHLDKQEILEQYLNRVPLGQGTVGVSAATALYFGSSPSRVSLGQAALLAALARAPSSQNPLVDPARAASRRRLGLEQLRASGYASDDEVERANLEPLLGEARDAAFLAPHFTSRILQWADRGGIPLAGAWRTSLDLDLQAELESEVRHTVATLADRGARHAAAVVLDNLSGEILAWVGSPDFWADTAGQVDMVVNPRQPGSALKPFLYALAFDRGFTASTVLADVPTTFQTSSGPYHPRNYDRNYHGPVRAREALGSSYNVPAVEIADRIGYATLLNGLEQAGFASLDRSADYYGLGLALGNGDVTLLELANGYRGLANGGVWRPYRWLEAEAGAMGSAGPERRFVSAQAAALVLDVLTDPIARVPGFGLETPFDFPFRVAAKTGTSRHFTDNWAVGVTANFTVAVWVGNFSGRPMQGVSGVSGAGPLLNRAVLVTAKRYAPGSLVTPREAGLVSARICRVSGMLATRDCPGATEWFAPGTEPTVPCDWHRDGLLVLPLDYADWEGARLGGSTDAQLGSSAGGPAALSSAKPAAEPPSRRVADPQLHIVSPQDGDRYSLTPGTDPRYATIALRSAGTSTAATRWFVDGKRVSGSRWRLVSGHHRFRAEAGGASAEAEIIVESPGSNQ